MGATNQPASRPLAPDGMMPPFARYSHGVEVAAGARLVFCSGQLGIRADGFVPGDAGEQAALCFENIAAILREAGMALEHVIRVNAYVTDRAFLAPYMRVRDGLFAEPFPASTLMIVSGFARPEFKVEVEAVAAASA
ncbi:MAG TPA: RidA family protein [Mesorhizobium sp.]|jgi:enamine deaminase RidA (YjgF/YER057c/UK114 family)|nr:RidA family protein [Mesorhizobium sp.]